MVAFAPWAFLSGPQSEFLRHLSAVIAFALAFSLIEAFCILPAHLRHLPARTDETRGFALQRRIADGIMTFAEKTYAPLLAKALELRYTLSAVFLAGFIVALTLASTGWVRFISSHNSRVRPWSSTLGCRRVFRFHAPKRS